MATKVDRTASMLCRRSGCSSAELAQRVIRLEAALRECVAADEAAMGGGEAPLNRLTAAMDAAKEALHHG